ncbi:MAG: hypothetical protein WCK14_06480 [Actinomycetota bacterium]
MIARFERVPRCVFALIAAATVLSGCVSEVGHATTDRHVVVSGYVTIVYSTGNFVLSDGSNAYHIVMLPTTSVRNQRGSNLVRQYIAPGGNTFTVSGLIVGSVITAQSVVVPITKDGL